MQFTIVFTTFMIFEGRWIVNVFLVDIQLSEWRIRLTELVTKNSNNESFIYNSNQIMYVKQSSANFKSNGFYTEE